MVDQPFAHLVLEVTYDQSSSKFFPKKALLSGCLFWWYNWTMTVPVPSEDQEQMWFVEWLDEQGIPYWHTNNEMWTKSWKQKNRAKAMGVKSGIPDLFLCFDGKLVGIEMKRTKGGTVSDNQKYWGTILEAAGIPCFVCRGRDHAVETVEELLASGEVRMMPQKIIENAEKLKEITEKKRKNKKNECPF